VRVLFEICVDSIDGVAAAARAGAGRVELCAALIEGGITPSIGTIELACRRSTIPVNVIIRPRGGDFLHTADELAVMERDIAAAKQAGAAGIVFGMLTAEGAIDVAATQRLLAAARPLPVTFHRAFDMCADPAAALEVLIGLGIDRVLTSGQEPTALEGSALIAALVRQAAGRIIVMPGVVNARTVGRVVAETGASEVHFAALEEQPSPMAYRNTRVQMGGALYPPEYARLSTSEALIRSVIAAARG
jgi:copper homeostasis protein